MVMEGVSHKGHRLYVCRTLVVLQELVHSNVPDLQER